MALVTIPRSPCSSVDDSIDEHHHDDSQISIRSRSASVDFFLWHSCATELGSTNASPRCKRTLAPESEHMSWHLKKILDLLRPEDRIKMAVRMQTRFSIFGSSNLYRYLCLISAPSRIESNGEEFAIIGADVLDDREGKCDRCTSTTIDQQPATIGLVEPVFQDLTVRLDGDGGFRMNSRRREIFFKPVSIRALWSAVQHISSAITHACQHLHHIQSLSHTWVQFYEHYLEATKQLDCQRIIEWNRMDDVVLTREEVVPPAPKNPTERQAMEAKIFNELRKLMYAADNLDDLTVMELRKGCEEAFDCSLQEYKEYISEAVLKLYGQMDQASEIFPYLYLGSTYNASNLQELLDRNVTHILNITREVDNFFADMDRFKYKNVRVLDEDETNLLEYWKESFEFISEAKEMGTSCLVHCKMGISRSASTVIAYAMKEKAWNYETAFRYVKERRQCVMPNPGFENQLKIYDGMLQAQAAKTRLRHHASDPTPIQGAVPTVMRRVKTTRVQPVTIESRRSNTPLEGIQENLRDTDNELTDVISMDISSQSIADDAVSTTQCIGSAPELPDVDSTLLPPPEANSQLLSCQNLPPSIIIALPHESTTIPDSALSDLSNEQLMATNEVNRNDHSVDPVELNAGQSPTGEPPVELRPFRRTDINETLVDDESIRPVRELVNRYSDTAKQELTVLLSRDPRVPSVFEESHVTPNNNATTESTC